MCWHEFIIQSSVFSLLHALPSSIICKTIFIRISQQLYYQLMALSFLFQHASVVWNIFIFIVLSLYRPRALLGRAIFTNFPSFKNRAYYHLMRTLEIGLLMPRIERKYCSISTSYFAGFFDISYDFILNRIVCGLETFYV